MTRRLSLGMSGDGELGFIKLAFDELPVMRCLAAHCTSTNKWTCMETLVIFPTKKSHEN